ncbi:hypothetical protein CHS0354_034857 [Potamilus streckersoni]|uniref:Sodium/bile acid cotransporter 7 n=1 Tax=Potamilus streckersoni TaxID=2493646 RepID=A0AAE0TK55_9BIVA|nr:hypothetical protein CHS0354_034857 [Potamilus streckersoni]
MGVFSLIRKNWFLVGIVIAIVFAKLDPYVGVNGGILRPEITVKYVAVFIIFFNSGISIKSEDLGKALMQFRLHIFVQGFTFIVFPFIVSIISLILSHGIFSNLIIEGLKIMSCMPPPVSSAVILTKAVGGNEAAAIFNSAFGSFLGIVVTPALIFLLIGSKADVPVALIVVQLSATVVLPLIIGQICRKFFRSWLERRTIPFGPIGSVVLLLIIYTTFCDTFSQKTIEVGILSLLGIVSFIVLLQCILLYCIFFFTARCRMNFSKADIVALMFCCTHKSLTLGIPIIKIIFAGYTGMSIISIPLLIYHPAQILLGGLLVPTVKKWLLSSSPKTLIPSLLPLV